VPTNTICTAASPASDALDSAGHLDIRPRHDIQPDQIPRSFPSSLVRR
jgi:hypothetical protein